MKGGSVLGIGEVTTDCYLLQILCRLYYFGIIQF